MCGPNAATAFVMASICGVGTALASTGFTAGLVAEAAEGASAAGAEVAGADSGELPLQPYVNRPRATSAASEHALVFMRAILQCLR